MYSGQLIKAITFAADKHRYQKRKNDGSSYICHPIDVMNILIEAGITDEDILCAAVLHDTVEDTTTSFDELQIHFNQNVMNYVDDVTDNKSLSKVTRKEQQILHAKDASFGGKLVKLADKISNLRDLIKSPPENWSKEIIKGYFVWSYAVVRNIWEINEFLKDKLALLFNEAEKEFNCKIVGENIDSMLEDYYRLL